MEKINLSQYNEYFHTIVDLCNKINDINLDNRFEVIAQVYFTSLSLTVSVHHLNAVSTEQTQSVSFSRYGDSRINDSMEFNSENLEKAIAMLKEFLAESEATANA